MQQMVHLDNNTRRACTVIAARNCAFARPEQKSSIHHSLTLPTKENAMRVLNRCLSTICIGAALALVIPELEANADQCDDGLALFAIQLTAYSHEFDAAAATSDKAQRCQAVKSLLGNTAYFIEITYNPEYIKAYLSMCSSKQIADSRAPFDALFRKIDDTRLKDGCGGF
jgi:hypothetical protein